MISRLSRYIDLHISDPSLDVRMECLELENVLKTEQGSDLSDFVFKPGQSIYMLGYAGKAGSDLIIRYHSDLLSDYDLHEDVPDMHPSGGTCYFAGSYMLRPKERGVFQSLFELHRISGFGFEILTDKIPISSVSAIITDHLSLNPYKLLTDECVIFIVPSSGYEDEEELYGYSRLKGENTFPVKIGHLTSSREMKLITSDTCSLLNRPGRDELLKILDRK